MHIACTPSQQEQKTPIRVPTLFGAETAPCQEHNRYISITCPRHRRQNSPKYAHRPQTQVWADTAYRFKKNEIHVARNGFVSQVNRKKPKGKPMPKRLSKTNARKSKVRALVEHVFAAQKGPMALFIRTIGIARARTKIGMANLVYNMKRLVWLQGRVAPA